jgi:hypothetical protein
MLLLPWKQLPVQPEEEQLASLVMKNGGGETENTVPGFAPSIGSAFSTPCVHWIILLYMA